MILLISVALFVFVSSGKSSRETLTLNWETSGILVS